MSAVKEQPALLSPEHLQSLKPGDSFESEGFFQGISDEPTRWVLLPVRCEKGEYLFKVTYMGVMLGSVRARINANGSVALETL